VTPVPASFDKFCPQWVQWFVELFNFVKLLVDYSSPSIITPVAGFNVSPTSNFLLLTPAGNLANGTIILQSSPSNGYRQSIVCTKNVAALTLSASGSDTISVATTALSSGVEVNYVYLSGVWYKLS